MKYLFIVQGEGHGHLTQALALKEILTARGHEITEVLVGKSGKDQELPDFFARKIEAPVARFSSPGICLRADGKRGTLSHSIFRACRKLPDYLHSMHFLKQRIESSGADVVVNFYEILCGLTYLFLMPSLPQVCIGHQYMFLHRSFAFPMASGRRRLRALRFFTRLTCLEAAECLALSFYAQAPDEKNGITVVPPLLRGEVLHRTPQPGNHIHGYMLNSGFEKELYGWHEAHPEIPLRFYRKKKGAPEVWRADSTLSVCQPDGTSFLDSLSRCRAYATTAGFESVCEAMYLGKPVMMVPTHVEQECNAFDAARCGAGIWSDDFDLSPLLDFSENYRPHAQFPAWARSAAGRIATRLEQIAAGSVQHTPQADRHPAKPEWAVM